MKFKLEIEGKSIIVETDDKEEIVSNLLKSGDYLLLTCFNNNDELGWFAINPYETDINSVISDVSETEFGEKIFNEI
jgi:hypothetical protein